MPFFELDYILWHIGTVEKLQPDFGALFIRKLGLIGGLNSFK